MESLWIRIDGDLERAWAELERRYREGPFREGRPDEQPDRVLEAMRDGAGWIVLEQGEQLHRHDFSRHVLAKALGAPIVQQGDYLGAPPSEASRLEPSGKQTRLEPFAIPAPWQPERRIPFVLDPQRQSHKLRAFEHSVESDVEAVFPVQNRARTAELSLVSIHVYGPNEKYCAGISRYEMTIFTELKLTLFGPRDEDGLRGPVLDVRKEKLVFARHSVLTPQGTFVHRGAEQRIPADEYAHEYRRMLRTFAGHIREAMNERETWTGVSPKTLVDP